MPLTRHSYAKLNLTLTVYPVDASGYHPIESVFQSISLRDTLNVTFTSNQTGFQLTCSDPTIPTDSKNLITQIYNAYRDMIPYHIDIHLEKQIPTGAGLGGGSSNAACFLTMLNTQCNWKKSVSELKKMAHPFGSDIPFFLSTGSATVSGIGDTVIDTPSNCPEHILLILPNIHCDTATVYRTFDQEPHTTPTPPFGHNDLRSACFKAYPKLAKIHTDLNNQSPLPIYLSGSGSTLFVTATTPTQFDEIEGLISTFDSSIRTHRCHPIQLGTQ